MLSLSENPPIVPGYTASMTEAQGKWWVGHTKSRFEKAFAWDLMEKQITYFLPMSPRTTYSGGRKRQGMVPLFPSYVFFCGDENVCWEAMRTNRLCQVLPVVQQGALVHELEQIQRILTSGIALDSHPTLPIGARCRIKSGPLKDLIGTVLERGKAARFVVSVTMLGQGTSLSIEGDLLEAVGDEPQEPSSIPLSVWRESERPMRLPA